MKSKFSYQSNWHFTTATTCGAWWNGLYHQDAIWWDPVNHAKQTDKVEIKDGAILELYMDYDGDNVLDVLQSVLDETNYIPHNVDDDNNNGIVDKLDGIAPNRPTGYNGVTGEDDLRKAKLYAWVEKLDVTNGQSYKFDVYQNHPTGNPLSVRLWKEDLKKNQLEVTNQNPDRKFVGTIQTGTNSVQQDFWIEGIAVAGNYLTAKAEAYQGTTRKSQFDGNESTYVFTPGVVIDLDIDSDNNGYINTVNTSANGYRRAAEDRMEEAQAKPVTYIPSAVESGHQPGQNTTVPKNNFSVPDDYVYVPLLVALGEGDFTGLYYTFHYTANIRVYEKTSTGYKIIDTYAQNAVYYQISTLQTAAEKYYVKAIGNGDSGQPSGNDKVHLVIWEKVGNVYKEIARDTISVKIQDNSKAPAWVIPSGWTIDGTNSFTTFMPVEGAIGPQKEGSYYADNDAQKRGTAYTASTYATGFTMVFNYSFVRNGVDGYVQVDHTNHNEQIDNTDIKKISFVGNSGVKIGGYKDVFEAQIIDMQKMVELVGSIVPDNPQNPNQTALDKFLGRIRMVESDSDEPNAPDIPTVSMSEFGYANEALSTLMNGVKYNFAVAEFANIQTSLNISNFGTPLDYYKAIFVENYNKFCGNGCQLKITWTPSTTGSTTGALKIYVGNEVNPYYQENNVSIGDARIYLQSHWGSGVSFSNIQLT